MSIDKLFFDALGVNIKIPEDDYTDTLAHFCMELVEFLGFKPTKGTKSHKSYNGCLIWENDHMKVFLNYNGVTPNMGAFIEVKGYYGCKQISSFINGLQVWKWTLTRADLTLDFNGGKATFERLRHVLLDYADQKGIDHFNNQGDWEKAVRGRTLYVGSSQSDYQIMLYEKSEEQWYQKKNLAYPPNMVRLESTYKPNRHIRHKIKKLDPCYVLAFNRNLSSLYGSICSTAIEHIRVEKVDEKSDEDKLNYAIDQYYAIIARFIQDNGIRKLWKLFVKRIRINSKLRPTTKSL